MDTGQIALAKSNDYSCEYLEPTTTIVGITIGVQCHQGNQTACN